MVPIASRHGRRQAQHISGLRSARHELEARGRQVVALVHYQVSVAGNEVGHFASAHQALNERYVEVLGWLMLAGADRPDVAWCEIHKRREALLPLPNELAPVHKDERVDGAVRDECRGDHRLAKRGGRGEHAAVVRLHGVERLLLLRTQRSAEHCRQRRAHVATILELALYAVSPRSSVASSRQPRGRATCLAWNMAHETICGFPRVESRIACAR